MSTWLTVTVIVLISIALFADLRRESAQAPSDVLDRDDTRTPAPEPLVRPNVRDPRLDGHPALTPRSRTTTTRSTPRDVPRR